MITACCTSYCVDDKGLSTSGQTESPALHTLWLYVLGSFLNMRTAHGPQKTVLKENIVVWSVFRGQQQNKVGLYVGSETGLHLSCGEIDSQCIRHAFFRPHISSLVD